MAKQPSTHVRQTCIGCGRLHTSHSRSGLWFSCQWCGLRQAGPGVASFGNQPPPKPKRRRATLTPPEPKPPRQGIRYLFGGK